MKVKNETNKGTWTTSGELVSLTTTPSNKIQFFLEFTYCVDHCKRQNQTSTGQLKTMNQTERHQCTQNICKYFCKRGEKIGVQRRVQDADENFGTFIHLKENSPIRFGVRECQLFNKTEVGIPLCGPGCWWKATAGTQWEHWQVGMEYCGRWLGLCSLCQTRSHLRGTSHMQSRSEDPEETGEMATIIFF